MIYLQLVDMSRGLKFWKVAFIFIFNFKFCLFICSLSGSSWVVCICRCNNRKLCFRKWISEVFLSTWSNHSWNRVEISRGSLWKLESQEMFCSRGSYVESSPDFYDFADRLCSRLLWEVKLTTHDCWMCTLNLISVLIISHWWNSVTTHLGLEGKGCCKDWYSHWKSFLSTPERGDEPPGGGSAVAARSACYHLHPVSCFLSLLPCHPGGCEHSPSWAENPLRLVSTRNSHACHPFHFSHAEGPGVCPPVFPWDRKLEEDPASRLSGRPGGTAALLPGWPSCPMIGSCVADWFLLQL